MQSHLHPPKHHGNATVHNMKHCQEEYEYVKLMQSCLRYQRHKSLLTLKSQNENTKQCPRSHLDITAI